MFTEKRSMAIDCCFYSDKWGDSMCEYCDISKYVCDYYGEADFDMQNELAIGDYTLLLMLYNSKTNKFGLKASGEGEAVIDINFCPKCGRNL